MNETEQCPCGNTKSYQQCCGLYIEEAQLPETAEQLMRSRYTAYTLQNDKYLLDTWHPNTRPDYKPSDDDNTTWTRLEILHTEDGLKSDTKGIVEFIAHCEVKGTKSHVHETSQFVHEDSRWYYLDGKGQQPVRRDNPKVGRNDPCPCGSNKKYNKCCGQ
jgi:SEC-C motif-containing protein